MGRVVLAVLLAINGLLLWENELRLYVDVHPYQVFVPDPVAFWKVNPRFDRGDVLVGDGVSAGLLDRDVALPKRGKRVLVLSDSQGLFSSPGSRGLPDTWPKQMQSLVGAEVVNGSVPGYSSHQGLILLRTLGMQYRPDRVVVALGVHDASLAFAPDSAVMTESAALYEARKVLYDCQLFLLMRHLALKGEAVMHDPGSGALRFYRTSVDEYRANLRAMAAMAPVAFVAQPLRKMSPRSSGIYLEYVEAMREVARETGAPFCDAFSAFRELPDALFTDENHLTTEGNRRMAELVAKAIPDR